MVPLLLCQASGRPTDEKQNTVWMHGRGRLASPNINRLGTIDTTVLWSLHLGDNGYEKGCSLAPD